MMRRFFAVVLAGFLGGSLCGIIVLIPEFYSAPHLGLVETDFQQLIGSIEPSVFLGVEFGGAFGIFAFPLSYYLFLRKLPLIVSLAYTVPATIVGEWLGMVFEPPHYAGSNVGLWFILFVYGPGFLGLLLSSIALSRLKPTVPS
jgi:hypothetical protein